MAEFDQLKFEIVGVIDPIQKPLRDVQDAVTKMIDSLNEQIVRALMIGSPLSALAASAAKQEAEAIHQQQLSGGAAPAVYLGDQQIGVLDSITYADVKGTYANVQGTYADVKHMWGIDWASGDDKTAIHTPVEDDDDLVVTIFSK